MADENAPTAPAQAPTPAPSESATPPVSGQAPTRGKRKGAGPRSTVAGRFWVTLGFTVTVIVLLIIFIAENSQRVTIHFLGAKGSISAALALLIAAVAGALIMLLVGSTRILQLRREIKRRRRP